MSTILPGFDFENFGAENDDDIPKISKSEIGASYLWATDWTVGTLIGQVMKGQIILNPTFQRRDAWKAERKSRFIESLLLNLPIPQIVLAEKASKLIVVDGKQRLLSIMQFYGSPEWQKLILKGLQILDMDGSSYDDIKDTDFGFAFENNTIRTVIMKNNPSDNYINLVINRLNSNSVALSAQELRQSLFSGPFVEFAEQYTRDTNYLSMLFGNSEPDFRMRDVELLIRHIAFKKYLKAYNGNLKYFLDSTCKKLNSNWKSEKDGIKEICEELKISIEYCKQILGKDAFRKFLPAESEYEYRFNRALYDICTFYFSYPNIRDKIQNDRTFTNKYKALFSDAEFIKTVEFTTKSTESVRIRFRKFGELVGIAPEDLI